MPDAERAEEEHKTEPEPKAAEAPGCEYCGCPARPVPFAVTGCSCLVFWCDDCLTRNPEVNADAHARRAHPEPKAAPPARKPAKPLCELAEQGSPSRKELCECGAEVAHPNHWFAACSDCQSGTKNTPICSACSELTCDERFLLHRALKHPERMTADKAMEMFKAARHKRAQKAEAVTLYRGVPKEPKPECACLSASCSACGPKLDEDRRVFNAMGVKVELGYPTKQALPQIPRYSPTAMMGGMWPVHGRK